VVRRLVLIFLIIGLALPPNLQAHNYAVHDRMTDLAFQIMLAVSKGDARFTAKPATASAADWAGFLAALTKSVPRLQALPSSLPDRTLVCIQSVGGSNTLSAGWSSKRLGLIAHAVAPSYVTTTSDCGVWYGYAPGGAYDTINPAASRDFSGTVLGLWAGRPDDEFDDTHLEIRPTNALGLGFLKDVINDLINKGLLIVLLPFVCLFDCIFGDCEDCDSDAKNLADGANVLDEIEQLIPGIGDISGADWTGVWHHINLFPQASNEFDNHQGLLSEAAFGGVPDPVEILLMAVSDAAGLSVNPDDSLGVSRYQISNGGDFHPNSDIRDDGDWLLTTWVHVPFSPVDNLAQFGWSQFKQDSARPTKFLGWPLHALGDATVPMHVTATSGWGHRPYEDAYDALWPQLRRQAAADEIRFARSVLEAAFRWRQFVVAWRAAHPGSAADTPVRDLVTALAKRTFDYSLLKWGQLGTWPFNPVMSSHYLIDKNGSIAFYADRPDAISLGSPPMVDGLGATIAFLMSASELQPWPNP
jgi:hypothetical protein